MLQLERILRADDQDIQSLSKLYISAFPLEERRDVPRLLELISSKKNMFFNKILFRGSLAGLCIYWDMGDFYFMEHFAIFDQMRNSKIGSLTLEYLDKHLNACRLMEVEPPEDEMSKRRIAYYERNGYQVLDSSYIQPSFRVLGDAMPLWIMGNLRPADLEDKIERIKTEVYRANL